MKKLVWIAAAVVFAGVAAMVIFRGLSDEVVSAQAEISESAAGALQSKIDTLKAAEAVSGERSSETFEVSEVELESYILFSLRQHIPVRVNSVDIRLSPGAVAADATITSAPNGTGNPLVDLLLGGTHSFYVKGTMSAAAGSGQFELEEVKVDGIPVPTILVETLISKYVIPKYPDVDLKKAFTMPWGIEDVTLSAGKATIVY